MADEWGEFEPAEVLGVTFYTPGQGDPRMEGGWETSTGAEMTTREMAQRGEAKLATVAVGPNTKHLLGRKLRFSFPNGEEMSAVATDYGPGVKTFDVASEVGEYGKRVPRDLSMAAVTVEPDEWAAFESEQAEPQKLQGRVGPSADLPQEEKDLLNILERHRFEAKAEGRVPVMKATTDIETQNATRRREGLPPLEEISATDRMHEPETPSWIEEAWKWISPSPIEEITADGQRPPSILGSKDEPFPIRGDEGLWTKSVKTYGNALNSVLQGATSPEALTSFPFFTLPGATTLWAGKVVAEIPSQVREIQRQLKEQGASNSVIQNASNMLFNDLIMILPVFHNRGMKPQTLRALRDAIEAERTEALKGQGKYAEGTTRSTPPASGEEGATGRGEEAIHLRDDAADRLETGEGAATETAAEAPTELEAGEVLFPTDDINFRGGKATKPSQVIGVKKKTNDQGKTVYAIRYTDENGQGDFLGYSENPAWETHPKFGQGFGQKAAPKLRPGEKGTGEMFQGEDQPFNLAGEEGIDYEARERATMAEEARAAEAKAKAEKDQGVIPFDEYADFVEPSEAEKRQIQAEAEAGLLEEYEAHAATGGDELADVLKRHGLPLQTEKQAYPGELEQIRGMFERGKAEPVVKLTPKERRQLTRDYEDAIARDDLETAKRIKERISQSKKRVKSGHGKLLTGSQDIRYNEIFRRGGKDLDWWVEHLKEKGFEVETINDVLDLIDTRFRTGKKVWGDEFRAQSLSEQSFGGPGAAGASEPLASYELRQFGERFVADKRIAQDIRDNVGNRYYEPISNKATVEEALAIAETQPLHKIINLLRDTSNGLTPATRNALAELAMLRLNEAHIRLRDAGQAKDAQTLLDQTIELAEWAEEFGTLTGQGLQSFTIWNRLTPQGKLIRIKRQVRKIRDQYESEHPGEVRQIKEIAMTEGMSEGELIKRVREIRKRNKTARVVKGDTGRILDIARKAREQPELFDEMFFDAFSEKLGLPSMNRDIAATIMRLAEEVDAAPEGMPKDAATLKLSKFIAQQMGFKASDVPIGIYYGNMLSGYNTQLVNAVDTFGNVVNEINNLTLTKPRAGMVIWSNVLKAFAESRADFLMALSRGRMLTDRKYLEVPRLMEVADFGTKGGVPPLRGPGGRVLRAMLETRPAKILNAWKYVTRLMGASDSIMFRGAREARQALIAFRTAEAQGLRGAELRRRVEQLMGRTREHTQAFEEQANQEGFTGAAKVARVAELREQARSPSARADAADFAGEATYNHDPHGLLGVFSRGVDRTFGQIPLLKAVIVPFTRIVANVTNRGLNNTPWGFKRAMFGYLGEKPPVGDARTAMLMRASVGTMALSTLGTMALSGVINLHGAGPSNPQRRRQLQDAGWKPYSIQIGNKYISYTYTPVGLGLSVIGNMVDSIRYKELEHKGAVYRAAYVMSRLPSTVFSQSFLSGLSNVFRSLSSEPGEVVYNLRKTFQQTAGTATTPRIITDIQRVFDPKRYDSDTITGDLLRNTPFTSLVNKPTLNAFGEPVRPTNNRFISVGNRDLAWQVVLKYGLRVPVPDKYTEMPDGRGGKRQISAEEYYDYLQEVGPDVKKFILQQLMRYPAMSPEQRQDQLDDYALSVRNRVLGRLRAKASRNPIN